VPRTISTIQQAAADTDAPLHTTQDLMIEDITKLRRIPANDIIDGTSTLLYSEGYKYMKIMRQISYAPKPYKVRPDRFKA
jgi:hypothetical protein